MQSIQIQLTAGEEILGKINVPAAVQLRLLAFAEANKLNLPGMIDLAVRYTVAPEEHSLDLWCPDEDDIVEFAAGMLIAK